MFDSFTLPPVLSVASVQASDVVYAAGTEGSFLAQPPLWGAVAVVASVLAYSGVWRGWARTPVTAFGKVPFPFGIGFFGVGILMTAIPFPIPYPANQILAYFALALMMFSVIGVLWLPRFLLPRWFKDEKGLLLRKTERPVRVDGADSAFLAPSTGKSIAPESVDGDRGSKAARDDILKVPEPGNPGGATAIGGYIGGAIVDSGVGSPGADPRGFDAGAKSSEMRDEALGGPEDEDRSPSD
ncbi:hypothetical protein [Clavibacter sp. VKM Ac-2872]|uniref:hypothetical protein n=1 Tax=Clavibacter sp. VKM Ac-2872 TaxID=2783812 RepID=UPI00188D6EF9|nr:hypothetical protein [Clavibacter sp. VKM Ac-2872]MBF4622783.1 hypothetical protein [Clavibacter sp. VKM Ac-2872]